MCVICKDTNRQHLRTSINRILLKFNKEKFTCDNPISGSLPRYEVSSQEWFACVDEIRHYLIENDVWVTSSDIHNHATRCNTYSRIFITPELPPVNIPNKALSPWSTAAIVYF